MKKKYFCLLVVILNIFISAEIAYSQENRSPYPIIFVHGLNSDNTTWNATINELAKIFRKNNNNIFHAVLNAFSYTKLTGTDTTLGTGDDDVLVYFNNHTNQLSSGDLYAVNFKNFWNQNTGNPQINFYSTSTPGNNQSKSNQSAIYKQGYALKKAIEAVLNATGAEKVILVGHSMGGLAIREYLQRTNDGTTGSLHTWWIDPNSYDGHKVAKVVTTGTPHRGSNRPVIFAGADTYAEACRDLRHYGETNLGIYLFGGDEGNLSSLWYNKDIDCNGILNFIVGINDGNDGTSYSINMPLPNNIVYSWITSKYFLDPTGDLAVDIDRQWLYDLNNNPMPLGVADSIRTDVSHSAETSDYYSIIRGLDEPDIPTLAYSIDIGKLYEGLATIQSNNVNNDNDWYKINFEGGSLSILFTPSGVGGGRIDFYTSKPTSNYDSQLFMSFSGPQPIEFIPKMSLTAGEYYIRIQHTDVNENDWKDPYYLSIDNLGKGTPNIAKLEYFIDSDPGLGNGINVPVTSENDISKTFEIPLTNTSIEIHTLGLRVQDQFGNWSLAYIRPFSKEDDLSNITNISYSFIKGTTQTPEYRYNNFISQANVDLNFSASLPSLQLNSNYLLKISAQDSYSKKSTEYYHSFLVSPNSELVLISPNGSENWEAGSNHNILWTNSYSSKIKIEYTTNNETNWLSIISSIPASDSSFSWTVPNTPSTQCRVRISNENDPNIFDASDDIFTIYSAGSCPYTDNYPYKNSDYNLADNWLFYYRECTSYVAYKINKDAGTLSPPYFFTNYMKSGHWGNAGNWASNAIQLGYVVDTKPQRGSIAQWNASELGTVGHVAYVEDVNADGSVNLTEYNYHLDHNFSKRCDVNNVPRFIHITLPSSVEEQQNLPINFSLSQNYPNPFNPTTTITYSIPQAVFVILKVYDLLGREVATIVNEEKQPGKYEVRFDGINLPSGIYFYRLQSGDLSLRSGHGFSETKKLILLK